MALPFEGRTVPSAGSYALGRGLADTQQLAEVIPIAAFRTGGMLGLPPGFLQDRERQQLEEENQQLKDEVDALKFKLEAAEFRHAEQMAAVVEQHTAELAAATREARREVIGEARQNVAGRHMLSIRTGK